MHGGLGGYTSRTNTGRVRVRYGSVPGLCPWVIPPSICVQSRRHHRGVRGEILGGERCLLRAKQSFGAAIFWTTLNPVARLRDERAIAMTNEAGRTGP